MREKELERERERERVSDHKPLRPNTIGSFIQTIASLRATRLRFLLFVEAQKGQTWQDNTLKDKYLNEERPEGHGRVVRVVAC